ELAIRRLGFDHAKVVDERPRAVAHQVIRDPGPHVADAVAAPARQPRDAVIRGAEDQSVVQAAGVPANGEARVGPGGHCGSEGVTLLRSHAVAKIIPNPCTRGLTPSSRTPFIRPCGVDETTGTAIAFSSGTIRSSVRSAPQDTTSASALFDR